MRASLEFASYVIIPVCYRFTEVRVAVHSDIMVQLMNLGDSAHCGHIERWHLHAVYDVTNTRGCGSLGILVHDSEYILIKAEQRRQYSQFLLLSELKSNETQFYTEVTNFTPKLRRCGSEPLRWTEPNSPSDGISSSSLASSLTSNGCSTNNLYFIYLFQIFVVFFSLFFTDCPYLCSV